MKNSRRGFLASLVALVPFAGIAQARSRSGGTSTVRIFNAALFPSAGLVQTSIATNSSNGFRIINSATFLDFTGTPGSTTSVSVIDPNTGLPGTVVTTTFPARGQVKQFIFNMLTVDNLNYTLSFPAPGSAT